MLSHDLIGAHSKVLHIVPCRVIKPPSSLIHEHTESDGPMEFTLSERGSVEMSLLGPNAVTCSRCIEFAPRALNVNVKTKREVKLPLTKLPA